MLQQVAVGIAAVDPQKTYNMQLRRSICLVCLAVCIAAASTAVAEDASPQFMMADVDAFGSVSRVSNNGEDLSTTATETSAQGNAASKPSTSADELPTSSLKNFKVGHRVCHDVLVVTYVLSSRSVLFAYAYLLRNVP